MMELEDDQNKLRRATDSLAKLRRLQAQSSDNCHRVVETLNQFDARLLKLEETVQPVYKETGNLQRQQENISWALSQLNYVIQFYTVAGEVEPSIINGPGSAAMYADYMRDLSRLSKAVSYFEHNNRESPELMNCSSLLEKGGQIVEKEFGTHLARHSDHIGSADLVLELIRRPATAGDSAESVVRQLIPLLDAGNTNAQKVLANLRMLAEWLCWHRNREFVQLYARLRSDVLTRSLNQLRAQLKLSSLQQMIEALGPNLSPLLGGRKNLHLLKAGPGGGTPEAPKTRGSGSFMRRLQEVSLDMLSAASPAGSAVTGGESDETDAAEWLDAPITEREMFGYVLTVTGLLKLMQLELRLVEQMVPGEHTKDIFSRVVAEALESVHQEGEQLAARVKRAVQQRQDFSSALYLLPVLRYQTHVRHSFDLLLDGCESGVASRLPTLVVSLQTTITKSLEEFLDYIKSDAHCRVPKDGTVHELTSNVMLFLVHLHSYLDILSRVVTVTDMHSVELSADKNRVVFAQYIWRVLSALGLSLRKRSESFHGEPALQALFRLNNTHYILKTLRSSQLLGVVALYRCQVEQDYLEQMAEFRRDYMQCWNRVRHHIDSDGLPSSVSNFSLQQSATGSSPRLKDRDRQAIKDRFTGFNKEFEAVLSAHRGYAIPDQELRSELKAQHLELVLRQYTHFYNRYVSVDFTKNVHKYIRYTPAHVRQSIETLFDELA